ncbi:YitT family protein [Gallaecimonas mangrovi]|uniref:YitT family protein n=1 Tax=Gallaecimonas mangrovi TaxID=2291597 RepID=UPI000E20883E|nr:YitT family protein [Gallaecimonas mangrovi]
MSSAVKTPDTSHSIIEDVVAMLIAAVMMSFGVFLLRNSGLVTGGTAGLALLLTHLLPYSFGQIFTVINLPFFYLAWKKMGASFTIRTFVSIVVVSVVTDHLSDVIKIGYVNPLYAAVIGGCMLGVGLLIFFRHKSSLGGFNIFVLYMQERFNIRAGYLQMGLDCTIVVASFFVISPWLLACSVVGAVAMNFILAANHKPGRYTGS